MNDLQETVEDVVDDVIVDEVEYEDPQEDTNEQHDMQEEPPEAQEARESGWVPKDEWKGDPNKWVPADEFNRRGKLFDTIHSQKREIGELKEAVGFLTDHTKKIEKITREKTIAEIAEQRRVAVEDGDLEAFEEADKEYQKAIKEESPESQDTKIDPVISEWSEKNSWFDTDPELQDYMIFQQNKNLRSGKSVAESLKLSEQAVRKTFAHKFENPNKTRAAAVMGNQSAKGKSLSESDLSPQERSIFRTLNRQVGMTLDEYVSELKKVGK